MRDYSRVGLRSFSFYHQDTGLFHPKSFMTDDESQVKNNTPADHLVIDGSHDHLSKRVDVETKDVVEYQPPQPSADHEWNDATKRWELSAASEAKQEQRRQALQQIELLEKAGIRAQREATLGSTDGMKRLAAIDTAIVNLRKLIGA